MQEATDGCLVEDTTVLFKWPIVIGSARAIDNRVRTKELDSDARAAKSQR